jgi:mannose-6-phosphate isomerase-like protein (cupin superfamily)
LHTGYYVSGRLHVMLDHGTEEEFGPGDACVIPPGHDAWVVGGKPVVSVDMSSVTAERYAKEQ